MKCDFCSKKKGYILGNDECGGGSYFEYCSKGHWAGNDLQLQDGSIDFWKNCPDFVEIIANKKEK